MSSDLINSVKQLMELGKGDPGRLEYILDMLINERILPLSDQKYLENILSQSLEANDPDFVQRKNEQTMDNLQKEIQNLNERLVTLERNGFERYVGKKAVFFFVTVFVGWNVLQPFMDMFLNVFLPANLIQYFFPLNLLTNYIDHTIIPFVFTVMMIAWLFIGFLYLVRFISMRKISNRR